MTDPTALDRLVDLLTDRGAAVVRAQPGDTLVLLMPDNDAPINPAYPADTHGSRIVEQLGALLPTIATIAVTGVTGGIVVPPAEQPPAPAAPPAEPTPAYVQHLLDAFLYGRPLDFHGDPVPIYVRQQLDAARAAGALPTAVTVPCPAGSSCYLLDVDTPPPAATSLTAAGGWCAPAADVDTTPTPRLHEAVAEAPQITTPRGGLVGAFPLPPSTPRIDRDTAATHVCCDSHNEHCEPPSELCCAECTEVMHPHHPAGVACVLQPGA